jgi:hypothetical protein
VTGRKSLGEGAATVVQQPRSGWADVRRAALQVLAKPPTENLDVFARILRTAARAHAEFDLEIAVRVQQLAQQMSPTLEGEHTLKRMEAWARGEPGDPESLDDQNSRRREFEELKRGARRRPPRALQAPQEGVRPRRSC